MPRKYLVHHGGQQQVFAGFNEAGADAPEIPMRHAGVTCRVTGLQ